jgi:hypothetical protein
MPRLPSGFMFAVSCDYDGIIERMSDDLEFEKSRYELFYPYAKVKFISPFAGEGESYELSELIFGPKFWAIIRRVQRN